MVCRGQDRSRRGPARPSVRRCGRRRRPEYGRAAGTHRAGGAAPQVAAWAIDALWLYVAAYCLERSIMEQRKVDDDAEWVVDRDELQRRLTALPAETFPQTTCYAAELAAGEAHDRFDFTIALMVGGLPIA